MFLVLRDETLLFCLFPKTPLVHLFRGVTERWKGTETQRDDFKLSIVQEHYVEFKEVKKFHVLRIIFEAWQTVPFHHVSISWISFIFGLPIWTVSLWRLVFDQNKLTTLLHWSLMALILTVCKTTKICTIDAWSGVRNVTLSFVPHDSSKTVFASLMCSAVCASENFNNNNPYSWTSTYQTYQIDAAATIFTFVPSLCFCTLQQPCSSVSC